ncbi:MAG: hypothetical protein QXO67_00585, partial [Candidatus Bathyarchaeia archaeon]
MSADSSENSYILAWIIRPAVEGKSILKIKPLTVILLATLCLCTAFVHKNVRTCAASGGASLKLVDVMVDYGNGTC